MRHSTLPLPLIDSIAPLGGGYKPWSSTHLVNISHVGNGWAVGVVRHSDSEKVGEVPSQELAGEKQGFLSQIWNILESKAIRILWVVNFDNFFGGLPENLNSWIGIWTRDFIGCANRDVHTLLQKKTPPSRPPSRALFGQFYLHLHY